ncbi:hypothetical protein E2C01_082351 [Portunus trituberculatus]|uniref:Uncharacterized protein n=1 Tax=Portunus trituberculatus TaxID=210409 RepID=A0A5B7IYV4_PORTR|nr:hypothetical protein [Portunus trituberculatus]
MVPLAGECPGRDSNQLTFEATQLALPLAAPPPEGKPLTNGTPRRFRRAWSGILGHSYLTPLPALLVFLLLPPPASPSPRAPPTQYPTSLLPVLTCASPLTSSPCLSQLSLTLPSLSATVTRKFYLLRNKNNFCIPLSPPSPSLMRATPRPHPPRPAHAAHATPTRHAHLTY